MGVITLFDKSFLQSLTINEAVWFDHFFMPNVCPLFYVETLADLEKGSIREGRTPEQEVGIIASKFPDLHGMPCAHHHDLCIQDLLGHRVPMTGQIPVAGGEFVKVGEKTGAVLPETPESAAFSRWLNGQFMEVERNYAKAWRESLSVLNLEEVARSFQKLGITGKSCKSLEEAKGIADAFLHDRGNPFEIIKLAIVFLNIPPQYHSHILQRWSIYNYPPLTQYAPYAAHVLAVEVFFQVALAAGQISTQRPSNRTDIGYLFYLPFCLSFVSSDRLHMKCAPLFLRKDQQFLPGLELKKALKEVNEYFSALPDAAKEQGIMSFAGHSPPVDGAPLLQSLWDRHFPGWRDREKRDLIRTPVKNEALTTELKKYDQAPRLSRDEIDFDPHEIDALTIKRRVRRRKGDWWQIPKGLEIEDD